MIWKNPEHKEDKARNKTVREYQQLGEKQWKEKTHYHMQSLVEGTMYRLKRLGRQLMARDFDRQVAEVHTKIAVLNRFTMLGMPVTVAI